MNSLHEVNRIWFAWLLLAILPGLAGAQVQVGDYWVTWVPEVYGPGTTPGNDHDPERTWSWSYVKAETADYNQTFYEGDGRYYDKVKCGASIVMAAAAHQASSNPPTEYANSWAVFRETWVYNGAAGGEPNSLGVDYRFDYSPISEVPQAGASVDATASRPPGAGTTGNVYTSGWAGSGLTFDITDPEQRYVDALKLSASASGQAALFGTPVLSAGAAVEPELPRDVAESVCDPEPWCGSWGFIATGYAKALNVDHNDVFSTAKPTYVLICKTGAGCGAVTGMSLSHPNYTGEPSRVDAHASGDALIESSVIVSIIDD